MEIRDAYLKDQPFKILSGWSIISELTADWYHSLVLYN